MFITKSRFLDYRACSTLFWFQTRTPKKDLTEGEELRITEGKELGELARKLYPNGALIEAPEVEEAALKTP